MAKGMIIRRGGSGAAELVINGQIVSTGVLATSCNANDVLVGKDYYNYDSIQTINNVNDKYFDLAYISGTTGPIFFSSDGLYAVLTGEYAAGNANKFSAIKFYKRDGQRYKLISTGTIFTTSLLTNNTNTPSMDSSATYLIRVTNASTTVQNIWKRTNDTWTLLSGSPISGLPAYVNNAYISPNSQYIICGIDASPFTTIVYKKGTGDTWSSWKTLTGITSSVQGCAWTSDSQYFCLYTSTTPFINVFYNDGTNITKLANPSILPAGHPYAVCKHWSPDGTILAVKNGSTSPYIVFYLLNKTTNTLTKIANPSTLPTAEQGSLVWTPDSRYCITMDKSSSSTALKAYVFERVGDTMQYKTNISNIKYSSNNSIAIEPIYGNFIVFGCYNSVSYHNGNNYIEPTNLLGERFIKLQSPNDAYYLDKNTTGIAYSKEAGAAGDTIDIVKLLY